MPQIELQITQGATEVASLAAELPTSSMGDLMTALRKIKEDSNSELTKLVDQQKLNPVETPKPDEDLADDDGKSFNLPAIHQFPYFNLIFR